MEVAALEDLLREAEDHHGAYDAIAFAMLRGEMPRRGELAACAPAIAAQSA